MAAWRTNGFTRTRAAAAVVGGIGTVALLVTALVPGWGKPDSRAWAPKKADALDLPNPGAKGTFHVGSLTYGSGRDALRKEFGGKVDLGERIGRRL